jgi:hypothetical protein
MSRILLGFFAKRILADDGLPLIGSAHDKIGFQRQTVEGLALEKTLELRARPDLALEDQVTALEQRPDVLHAECSQEISKIGHPDLTMAADIDAADESDMSCQNWLLVRESL